EDCNYPTKKSRLIPKQAKQVYEMCDKAKRKKFPILENEQRDYSPSDSYIHKDYMVGLTRRERDYKKILLVALEPLKYSNNIDELLYWLSEWENESCHMESRESSIKELYQYLYDRVTVGWS